MTEHVNNLVTQFVEKLSNLPYGEVLDGLNVLMVRIFVCAPQGSSIEAMEDCHKAQHDQLLEFIREKEAKKSLVDGGIEGFNQFSRETGGTN
jgi:hypothetical protein